MLGTQLLGRTGIFTFFLPYLRYLLPPKLPFLGISTSIIYIHLPFIAAQLFLVLLFKFLHLHPVSIFLFLAKETVFFLLLWGFVFPLNGRKLGYLIWNISFVFLSNAVLVFLQKDKVWRYWVLRLQLQAVWLLWLFVAIKPRLVNVLSRLSWLSWLWRCLYIWVGCSIGPFWNSFDFLFLLLWRSKKLGGVMHGWFDLVNTDTDKIDWKVRHWHFKRPRVIIP